MLSNIYKKMPTNFLLFYSPNKSQGMLPSLLTYLSKGNLFKFFNIVRRRKWQGTGNPLQYSCLRDLMDREPGGLQSIWLQERQT